MQAIKSHGLYIFYPIFHGSLYCRDVTITDNLCTEQGNSSIFGPKICLLQSRAVSNEERVLMALVRYLNYAQTSKKGIACT